MMKPAFLCVHAPSAGDMLDCMVDPAFLRGFPNLFVLCLTTSMFYRMTR